MKKFAALFGVTVLGAALMAAPDEKKGDAKSGAGDAVKGKEIAEQCTVCHNLDSDEKKMGPALKGLFKKAKLNNGKKPTEAVVRQIVDEGGNGMPPYAEMLSKEEKDYLIAFLKTL